MNRRLTDDFLLDIYRRFEKQATVSERPAVDLATEFEVPPATMRRWVDTARRKGLVPRTGQGKGPSHKSCPTCGASPSRWRTQ